MATAERFKFRRIRNYVARMRGPQSMKLALDLTRTKFQIFFRFRSIRYPHRPHERFSRRRGRKTVIFSRFLRDCGRLEYAIKNWRKPLCVHVWSTLSKILKAEVPTSRSRAYPKPTKWTLYPGTEGGKGGGTFEL